MQGDLVITTDIDQSWILVSAGLENYAGIIFDMDVPKNFMDRSEEEILSEMMRFDGEDLHKMVQSVVASGHRVLVNGCTWSDEAVSAALGSYVPTAGDDHSDDTVHIP